MTKTPLIFCVDDNKTNLNLLKKSLKDFETELLFSGQECIDALSDKLPDLILLDVMMPVLNGIETCKLIRQTRQFKDIPVIFLSAKNSIEDKLEGYAVGGDDYIGKPFDLQELIAKINATLLRKQQLDSIQDRAKNADASRREIMSSLKATGTVVDFLQNALKCDTVKELANNILAALQILELDVVLQINDEGNSWLYSTNAIESPLEQSVFEFVKGKGHIVSFGERTAVNYPNISIIVRNMPADDTQQSARIRDHVDLIGKGANAKIDVMQKDRQAKHKFSMLIDFMHELKDILGNLDQAYEQHQEFTETILGRVAEELEESFMQLGLTEFQEESQRKIVELAEMQIREKNDSFSMVHKQFSSMHRQIDTVLEHTVKAMNEQQEEQTKDPVFLL